MRVVKRDGSSEDVDFSMILSRLERLCATEPPLDGVDISRVAQKVVGGIVDGITTRELDTLAAETAAGYALEDPAYDRLAARIVVSDLHKRTPESFVDVVDRLAANTYTTSSGASVSAPLVTDELRECAREFGARADAETDHDRDYGAYTYFGIRTVLNGYTLLLNGEPAERPSHMIWRVAFGIHGRDWPRALATYRAMAAGAMTHASPTLFYAGTPSASLSSCFLTQVSDDSIEGIYDTIRDCAVISKAGGGLGVAVSRIRASGALVRSTGRSANGIMPALRVLNETARHVTQGGRRKGAIAVYIEPHHADVFALVDVRKNHGTESDRARDLFPALWVSDLFMRRVEADEAWTLFSPDTAPGLDDVFGAEYERAYSDHERAGIGVRTVRARELWNAILVAQCETGTPYILFKDTVNRANAQANVGVIRCSNLCSEICLHVSEDETAVCNLASIALSHFVDETNYTFEFARLEEVVAMTVANLDAVIDRTQTPTASARLSNTRNRPIGIGVQGLADVFMALQLPFDSARARELNVDIFDTIYRAALDASADLARDRGAYPTYPGSPASRGDLQPDLFLAGGYGSEDGRAKLRARVNTPEWRRVRDKIARFGLRHSLVTALMPTASTAQILGNVEAFEALGSNVFVRRTLAGEFTLVNDRLVRDLKRLGMWTEDVRHAIVRAGGSVQELAVPDRVKSVYRTVWEVSQRSVCQMAADRTPFVDQSQSLNIHMVTPTTQKLTSLHFLNWRAGVKTSTYYVRSQAASAASQVTVPVVSERRAIGRGKSGERACDAEDGGACVMCSA